MMLEEAAGIQIFFWYNPSLLARNNMLFNFEKIGRNVLLVFGGIVTAFFVIEMLAVFLLNDPQFAQKTPPPLLNRIRALYMNERKIIQFENACSGHDSELTYRMKPPGCVFQNREYRNHFSINHQGFRDDEGSLMGPEIIVLGDSVAAGWGVDQDDTFSQLLEKMTGKKVLNAGDKVENRAYMKSLELKAKSFETYEYFRKGYEKRHPILSGQVYRPII